MRDPLYIDQWNTEIPEQQRAQYEKVKLSNDALQHSLNEAHDRIRGLTKTNNAQAQRLQAYQRRLDVAGWKLWTLGAAVAGEFAALGWLVQAILKHK